MFCVMLMSWWLGGPLEDMRQVKLYLIHTSSRCCRCKLEPDFKVVLQVRADEELIAVQTLPLCLAGEMKAGFDISHFALCYFQAELCSPPLENTWGMMRQNVTLCAVTPLYHWSHLSKGQAHGTLISPYPLYCPTLTPPCLPVFALALSRTSVTAPATVACSLPSHPTPHRLKHAKGWATCTQHLLNGWQYRCLD